MCHSVEEESGSDHLISVFCLLALVNGVAWALRDLFLLRISVIEPSLLVACHGQFVFTLDFSDHATVLDTVLAHLGGARVLATLCSLFRGLLPHASQRALELFHRHTSILIQIELLHEHFDLFFQRWETICLSQKVLNFIRGDSARAIFVDFVENSL